MLKHRDPLSETQLSTPDFQQELVRFQQQAVARQAYRLRQKVFRRQINVISVDEGQNIGYLLKECWVGVDVHYAVVELRFRTETTVSPSEPLHFGLRALETHK